MPRRSTRPGGSSTVGSRRPACRSRCGSGGRTKFNRTTRGLSKTHWLDAACVGASTPEHLGVVGVRPLLVKACGHGKRNRCWTDQARIPAPARPPGEDVPWISDRRSLSGRSSRPGSIAGRMPDASPSGTGRHFGWERSTSTRTVSPLFIGPTGTRTRLVKHGFCLQQGAAIPPSPKGDGPLAGFLWTETSSSTGPASTRPAAITARSLNGSPPLRRGDRRTLGPGPTSQ